jgi:hypothetical protein
MSNESEVVRIVANHNDVKHLGHWTTANEFEVHSDHGATTLDLRSTHIEAGDIKIKVLLNRAMLKLLAPDDAAIDEWDLRRSGRGKLKDGAAPAQPTGRKIIITGEMKGSEIRINRGGVAVMSAMFSRAFLQDVLRSRREGGTPSTADPQNHP